MAFLVFVQLATTTTTTTAFPVFCLLLFLLTGVALHSPVVVRSSFFLYVCSGRFRSCEHDILKANEPILMQLAQVVHGALA